MSGLSLSIILEIFNNPDDLTVVIVPEGEKFGFMFMRGPGHNYKTLFIARSIYVSKEDVVAHIAELLSKICIVAREQLSDMASEHTELVNPKGFTAEELDGLDEGRIESIVRQLRETGSASTYAV